MRFSAGKQICNLANVSISEQTESVGRKLGITFICSFQSSCFSYHQAIMAPSSGAVTIMVSVLQSFIR